MSNRFACTSTSLAVLFVVAVNAAIADTVTVGVLSTTYNTNQITANIAGLGQPYSYRAGLFGLNSVEESAFTGATTVSFGTYSNTLVAAFCIDLGEFISLNNNQFLVEENLASAPANETLDPKPDWSPMGEAKAIAMRQLWYNNFGAVQSSGAYNSVASSAFQIAIHEILVEKFTGYGQWDLADGDYQIVSVAGNADHDSIALAQQWLNALSPTDPMAYLKALVAPAPDVGNKKQDLIYQWMGGGEEVEVPEPHLLMAIAGLLAMGGIARIGRSRTTIPSR